MKIEKSHGVTRTEEILADLCEKTFLKLWSYPNPYKEDGKEMCDLLAVFENHVFVFFVREAHRFGKLKDTHPSDKDLKTQWLRWKRQVIDKQIKTANGVERYLKSGRDIFIDKDKKTLFPIDIDRSKMVVHKIIIALGAEEACKKYSSTSLTGSLKITYATPQEDPSPFAINLERENPVHILDGYNWEIVFLELDTFADFIDYLEEKVKIIRRYEFFYYYGEENLLAHYFFNYDKTEQRYRIDIEQSGADAIMVTPGIWSEFCNSKKYWARKDDNEVSYFWDDLIQQACQSALDGTLVQVENDIWRGNSAVYEMAKESRLGRRKISCGMIDAIQKFPENGTGIFRRFILHRSSVSKTGYVFLQMKRDDSVDYETVYRPERQKLLIISCGVLRNHCNHLNKVIGIAIDAPKFSLRNSEDFVLMECVEWSDKDRKLFENEDELYDFPNPDEFFYIQAYDFPSKSIQKAFQETRLRKPGRNQPCPCGSGKKFKKCCGPYMRS